MDVLREADHEVEAEAAYEELPLRERSEGLRLRQGPEVVVELQQLEQEHGHEGPEDGEGEDDRKVTTVIPVHLSSCSSSVILSS